MNADDIRSLFEYNCAMHRRLWNCIAHLSDAQYVEETGYSLGSVRNHMVHLMGVDERWLARVQDAPLPPRVNYADFPTQAATLAYWNGVETGVLDYVRTVDDAALQREIHFDMPHRGGTKTNHVWEILAHVVNHGTDHRAQVLTLLHGFGAPTLEQDFILYLWDSGQG